MKLPFQSILSSCLIFGGSLIYPSLVESAVFDQSVHNFGSKAQAAIAEIESLTEEVLEILTMKQGNSYFSASKASTIVD